MIGLFIGSFNPPTKAHLEICLALSKRFTKIILVPVNSREKELAPISDRINMLNIYKTKEPFLVVDDIMKNYSYLNYRIIDILKRKYGANTLIMGSDLLDKLDTFDNTEYLLTNYYFVIMERNGYNSLDIIHKKYDKYQDRFTIISYHNDISSTLARNLLKKRERNILILDKDILNYINENDLY